MVMRQTANREHRTHGRARTGPKTPTQGDRMLATARRFAPIALLTWSFALTGCGVFGPMGPTLEMPMPESTIGQLRDSPDITMFDGQSGEALTSFDLFDRTTEADVVVFGELHGHPVGLPVAAAIWEDMLRVRDESETPALLLEFFERDQQTGQLTPTGTELSVLIPFALILKPN